METLAGTYDGIDYMSESEPINGTSGKYMVGEDGSMFILNKMTTTAPASNLNESSRPASGRK